MYLRQNKELKLKKISTTLKIFSTFSSLPFSSPKCHSLHQFPPIGFKKKVQLFCSTNSIVSFFLNSSLMLQWQWWDTSCFQINVLNFFFPCLFFLSSTIKHKTLDLLLNDLWGEKKKKSSRRRRKNSAILQGLHLYFVSLESFQTAIVRWLNETWKYKKAKALWYHMGRWLDLGVEKLHDV